MYEIVALVIDNLLTVQAAIATAAEDAERPASSVALIAVSKTVAASAIEPLLEHGHRRFGENYVQEAKAKWPSLKGRFPDSELHLIGPLQTNKVRDALALFDVIHSLDRPRLAAALAAEMGKTGAQPRLLCQVNTGEEPRKGGVLPADADAFLRSCRAEFGLAIEGLMCIPPADQPPSPHFALLRSIADRNGLEILSMGMSADYRAAIQLGATHVRVGTAIFGARPPRREAEVMAV